MLLIGLYVVFVLLIAAAAIWVYRKVFARHDFRQALIGRTDSHIQMTLKAQQGFITLGANDRRSSLTDRRLRRLTGDVKAPWGW